jgi:beta,beta-carotene 9',10'-dioxygenase
MSRLQDGRVCNQRTREQALRNGELKWLLLNYYPVCRTVAQAALCSRSEAQWVALSVGKLTRFRIGPRGDVREEELSTRAIELPRIHYRGRVGRAYRYVYAAGNEVPGQFFDNLVKLDLQRAAAQSWREADCYQGEPVFVSRPSAIDEDDGVVISVVLDAKRGTSFLLLTDAATFDEVARVHLPHVVTFGFHGNFFPAPAGEDSFRDLHR